MIWGALTHHDRGYHTIKAVVPSLGHNTTIHTSNLIIERSPLAQAQCLARFFDMRYLSGPPSGVTYRSAMKPDQAQLFDRFHFAAGKPRLPRTSLADGVSAP